MPQKITVWFGKAGSFYSHYIEHTQGFIALLAGNLVFIVLLTGLEVLRYQAGYLPDFRNCLQAIALPGLCVSALSFSAALLSKGERFGSIKRILSKVIILSLALTIVTGYFAFLYQRVTGSTVDSELFYYSLINSDELIGVFEREAGLAPLLGGLVFLLIVPFSAELAESAQSTWIRTSVAKVGAVLGIVGAVALTWSLYFPQKALANYQGVYRYLWGEADLIDFDEDELHDIFYGGYEAADHRPTNTNIVILIIESLRGMNFDDYGKSEHSPWLNEITNDFQYYANVKTSVTHTTKALVSAFCGSYPYLKTEIIESHNSGLPFDCLPKILAKQGYQTAFLQSADQNFEHRRELAKNFGFEIFVGGRDLKDRYGAQAFSYFHFDDRFLPQALEDHLAVPSTKPRFISILNVTTHSPYDRESKPCKDSHKNRLECYQNMITYYDEYIREIFSLLKKHDLYKESLIFVVGDHGEAFGEHGLYQHDWVMYEEVLRVPLWVRWPDSEFAETETQVDRELRSILDITPTALELLGVKRHGNLPGKSLHHKKGHYVVYSYCWSSLRCSAISRSDGTKLIAYPSWNNYIAIDLNLDPDEKNPTIKPESAIDANRELILHSLSVDRFYENYYNAARDDN